MKHLIACFCSTEHFYWVNVAACLKTPEFLRFHFLMSRWETSLKIKNNRKKECESQILLFILYFSCICKYLDLCHVYIQTKKISDIRKLDTKGFIAVYLFQIPLCNNRHRSISGLKWPSRSLCKTIFYGRSYKTCYQRILKLPPPNQAKTIVDFIAVQQFTAIK